MLPVGVDNDGRHVKAVFALQGNVLVAHLHAHPAVADALVVPAPDPKYGQRVAAVISLTPGFEEPSLEEIQDHCRQTLARYKVPRTVVVVDEVKRTPAGKADYKWAKDQVGAN